MDKTELTEEEINEILEVANGNVKEAQPPEGVEMVEWIYSNDKSDKNPIRQLFHLFYDGVFKNRIGLMHCLNTETKEIDTVIVGIQTTDKGVGTWPLARVLTEDEQGKYLAPDGHGSYLGLQENSGNDTNDSEDE